MKQYITVLFTFFASILLCEAGISPLDSLKNVLKTTSVDTLILKLKGEIGEAELIFRITYWDSIANEGELLLRNASTPQHKNAINSYRANAINNIGFIYDNEGDINKALEYYKKSLKIREEIKEKNGIALSLNNIGSIYLTQGKISEALISFKRSVLIQEEIGDKKGMTYTLLNLGGIYDNQGDVEKALEYYHRSLKINEELDDKQAMSSSLNNIGSIYDNQGDLIRAIDYYNKCLKIREILNDKRGIALVLGNLGNVYKKQNKLDKAFANFKRSLVIQEEIKDKNGILYSQNNIGQIYLAFGDPDCKPKNSKICMDKGRELALVNFEKSLKIAEEIENKLGIATSLNYISSAYVSNHEYLKAQSYAERSLKITQELGYPENIKNAAFNLKQIYIKTNKPAKAFEMLELYMAMRDSVSNAENRKLAQKQEFKHEWEKREAQIKADQDKKDAVTGQEKHRQQLILWFALFGLLMVIVFLAFMYKRYKITQRQKVIIEEKNKEITDSIQYASRIQRAMLTSEDYIKQHLTLDHFIFYQPKDIVSGDFYWATQHQNAFYIITADCTGHGVPGAFMSLLNINLLHEHIVKENILDPSEIFNHQRLAIIKALNPKGTENSKDGMDCVITKYDLTTSTLTFTMANNPIYIIRNKELTVYKADKMPVGLSGQEDKLFSQHEIKLQKGDIVYTFTDGYPDQFGGPQGKKFMYKQFKELLTKISHLPMIEQKLILQTTINEWMNKAEQIDDILVIGVRI